MHLCVDVQVQRSPRCHIVCYVALGVLDLCFDLAGPENSGRWGALGVGGGGGDWVHITGPKKPRVYRPGTKHLINP